jgi:Ca2+-binding EF-hand superfamily protein
MAPPLNPGNLSQSLMETRNLASFSTTRVQAIAKVFRQYDHSNAGMMTKAELRDCIRGLNGRNLDEFELSVIIHLMSGDAQGTITLESFTRMMLVFFQYC